MDQNSSVLEEVFIERRQNYIKKISDMPKRPQRANLMSIGQEIHLCTNHFQIDLQSMFKTFFVYGVNIYQARSQESEDLTEFPRNNRTGRRCIHYQIDGKLKELLGKNFYNGGLNLWAFKRIAKEDSTIITSFQTKKIIFQLEEPKQFTFNDLLTLDELSQAFRQMLNVITKTNLEKLGYIENGKDMKFFKLSERDKNVVESNDMLKVWHGYKTSVHVYDKHPMLMIDFSVRVLRSETALQRIEEYEKCNYNDQDIDEKMQENSVKANYGGQLIYRVHKVDFTRNPMSKFMIHDNKEITYVEYFKDRYGLTIKNQTQPLLIHNKNHFQNYKENGVLKKRRIVQEICLIPELVNMTGIRDDEKSNRNLMKNLAEYTKLEPQKRMTVIHNLKRQLEDKFKDDGYQLANLQDLQGILMTPPKIYIGDNKSFVPNNGNFLIKDLICQPTEIKGWIMLYQKRGPRDDDEVDEFIETLIKAGTILGIKIAKPFLLNVSTLEYTDWEKDIRKQLEQGGVSMIMTLMPDKQKGNLYKDLKRLCYHELGIPHQNVLSRVFCYNHNKLTLAMRIALQMIAKLGKSLWYVEPVKGLPKKTMIIGNHLISLKGVDVYHKKVQKRKSCAGFVASLDENFSSFYSSTVIQPVGVELMKGIANEVKKAIDEYLKVNKYLPELIIIFRDGVGDSQIIDVLNIEVEQIKALFPIIDPKYKPQFAEIIINKRINQRFFSENKGQILNPYSGTLVCDRVVHDEYFEFFIVPQTVTQGTATPTLFKVIENSTTLSQETFFQLTYFQCHNYANWTGAVRVPAPTMYAHKLAYLVGETFQDHIHENLKRTLCFL